MLNHGEGDNQGHAAWLVQSSARASTAGIPFYVGSNGKRAELRETPDRAWVEAAQGLYQKVAERGARRAPQCVQRDVRRAQQTMPWTVEVRRRIGRFLFGARAELGEPLFLTLSPTTRRNGLCSRHRCADPAATGMSGPWFARDSPRVWETADVHIQLPSYDAWRRLTARDPWAVVAFQAMVRFVFGTLLGLRMCFRCPNCTFRDHS